MNLSLFELVPYAVTGPCPRALVSKGMHNSTPLPLFSATYMSERMPSLSDLLVLRVAFITPLEEPSLRLLAQAKQDIEELGVMHSESGGPICTLQPRYAVQLQHIKTRMAHVEAHDLLSVHDAQSKAWNWSLHASPEGGGLDSLGPNAHGTQTHRHNPHCPTTNPFHKSQLCFFVPPCLATEKIHDLAQYTLWELEGDLENGGTPRCDCCQELFTSPRASAEDSQESVSKAAVVVGYSCRACNSFDLCRGCHRMLPPVLLTRLPCGDPTSSKRFAVRSAVVEDITQVIRPRTRTQAKPEPDSGPEHLPLHTGKGPCVQDEGVAGQE